VPLQDGQRAIRVVRSNAAEWGIDPKRIGIVGLSSGGHMASMIGTSYDRKVYAPVDAGDAVSARPDYMILAYGPHSSNARKYLLNPAQAPVPPPQKQALYDEYPTDRQVTKDTPPAFLMHTDEDNRVDPRNSVRFYMALKEAGSPRNCTSSGTVRMALRSGMPKGCRSPPGRRWPKNG
jgi:acetyl esterase/lipase